VREGGREGRREGGKEGKKEGRREAGRRGGRGGRVRERERTRKRQTHIGKSSTNWSAVAGGREKRVDGESLVLPAVWVLASQNPFHDLAQLHLFF
jgi:hypothetical protein